VLRGLLAAEVESDDGHQGDQGCQQRVLDKAWQPSSGALVNQASRWFTYVPWLWMIRTFHLRIIGPFLTAHEPCVVRGNAGGALLAPPGHTTGIGTYERPCGPMAQPGPDSGGPKLLRKSGRTSVPSSVARPIRLLESPDLSGIPRPLVQYRKMPSSAQGTGNDTPG